MRTFLLVCAAGAAGTGARYLVALGMASMTKRTFPFAVLAVNVIGSFAIGAVTAWAYRRGVPAPVLAMITTGFLGGFTTYSAFNYDLTMYIAEGAVAKAALYAMLMVGGCILAGLAGLQIVR